MKKIIITTLFFALIVNATIAQIKPSQMSPATIASFKNVLGINEKLDTSVAKTTYVKTADIYTPTSISIDTLNATAKMTAPTKDAGTNTTDVATTAWVQGELLKYSQKVDCGSNARITHTGTTNLTTVKTLPTIPAGRIGVNGELFIEAVFDGTSGGSPKTYVIYINGTQVFTYGSTANPYHRANVSILCRNSLSSQVVHFKSLNIGADTDVTTTTIDFSQPLVITIALKVDDAGQSAYLESVKAYTTY